MKDYKCQNCGASDFIQVDGKLICSYCGAVYQPDTPIQAPTTIALADDVQALLQKMREDPANARRYANLVLDLDPTNTEILKYLR
ncbi:TFIIB-type zinc finger domain-containing protein [Lacticaseibacillus jixiensis]|uniref:TFIIB-type zinc finger domain-containing protein n=1 Tax=Lacticaseibacillus jixiensis TaxID=3231926 RepID=UPI0036F1A886